MRIRHHFWLISSVVSVLACSRPRSVAMELQCLPNTLAVWSADSLIALCVPSDFVPGSTGGWGRPGVGTSFHDFISLEVLTWPRDSTSIGQWPPHIASGSNCFADCATADSVRVHDDSIAGFRAQVETGLASGGIQGWRRKPFLITGWTVSDSLRVYGYAWARRSATIDSLRVLLSTVRLSVIRS